jgi:phenylalanyl-tRNA synthetase beta chain
MLLSLNWLKEFTPYEGSVQELADRLTMTGLEIEEIRRPFAHLDNTVVGRVVECGPHPDADKLSLCSVDVGDGEPLPIVCGAPNVAKGQKVAVAKVGSRLPGGEIKKAKIRGQVSQGMILAEDEAQLGEDHSGIMVLDDSLAVGTPIIEALNLDDVVFDVGVTPNRADCLSVLGLAREVAMIFGLPLTMPDCEPEEFGDGDAAAMVEIEIDDPELCPVYQARILTGVSIGKSPAWLRYRLRAVGLRPINNIVDVTNYVMFELGQPLHAFDRRLLEGDKIRVATADDGMKFTTLDDQQRTLTKDDLLIWDAKKPVGLAGVMGGANTEMRDDSTEVLLESAVFRPGTIRKTARRLALPSESSYRFERGVDQPGSHAAMNRAAKLMAELSGAKVVPGVAKNEAKPFATPGLRFRREKAEKLLGVTLEEDFCKKTLAAMGCEFTGGGPGDWRLTAPSHRLDLEREVDLIEEVARVYGMDAIPDRLPRISKSLESIGQADTTYDFNQRLKEWARGAGLNEAVNYSFVGNSDLDALGLPAEERVPVKNPLSEDQDVLRTRLAPGLMQNLRLNLAQGNDRLRLFELAHLFLADPKSPTTAKEPQMAAILLYGRRNPTRWPFEAGEAGYEDLKGLVEHLLHSLRLPGGQYRLMQDSYYQDPCVEVLLDGEHLGTLGRIKPEIADVYNARKDVWLAELDADLLKKRAEAKQPAFAELPKFPPVRRDVTAIAPPELSVEQVLNVIGEANEKLLQDVTLIDVFSPEDKNERNLTFRLTYRHPEKTLKDKEVDKRHKKIVDSITAKLPVRV